jgi:hypothetical protein
MWLRDILTSLLTAASILPPLFQTICCNQVMVLHVTAAAVATYLHCREPYHDC